MPRGFLPGEPAPGGGPRPDIQTKYFPGEINVQTQAPGAGAGANNQLMALLGPLLDWKMAMAERAMRPQGPAIQQGARLVPPGPGREGRSSVADRSVGRARGNPIFTKMVGGPQMVPGRIMAQPWEQGAAFSGYGPPGFTGMPNSASFAGPQGAELTGPGHSIPGAARQAAVLDPFPHGTGVAFAAAQMEDARRRSDQEYDERQKRRAAGSKE